MDTTKVSKIDAASRQLDAAIRLLFSDFDIIAVHTLAGTASKITSDLVEKLALDKSWDKAAQTVNNLSSTEYFRIVRETQNFLKHAKNDADEMHEFALSDTEYLIFWAVMNLAELRHRLTIEQSAFQLWFLASQSDVLDPSSEVYKSAISLFGDLTSYPRADRLAAGLSKLKG